jgi:sterol desaturase/sphingolipid hydroxylase (fatty acid hydroxylase superfamily)
VTTIVGFLVVNALLEILFYTTHRLLHHPALYAHAACAHAVHHEFPQPVALAALYCSPLELILVDMTSVMLGPWLLDMSLTPLLVWLAIVAWDVAVGHSGHTWVWFHDAQFHEAHHRQRRTNFGVWCVIDKWLGTASIIEH